MSTSQAGPYRLHVLGAPDLRAPDGRRIRSVLSQPKRLGLLTYLALSPGPVTRATVVAAFWPESDETHARNALSQALFYLRRSLGEDVIRSVDGDRLMVPPERVWCDARELLAEDEPSAEVVEAGSAALLQGWNADESQPLQEWLDGKRRKLAERRTALGGTARAASPRAGSPPPVTLHSRRRPPPWAWLTAAAVGAIGAVTLLVGPSFERPAPPPTVDLAVLMPDVVSSPDAPALSAQAIDDEVLAHLPEVDGLRIRDASYSGTLGDLRRQLTAVGAPSRDAPRWILDTRVRAGGDAIRVVALLYRGPSFEVAARAAFDVRYGGADAVLLEVPQEIARGVAGMVEGVLEGEGPGG